MKYPHPSPRLQDALGAGSLQLEGGGWGERGDRGRPSAGVGAGRTRGSRLVIYLQGCVQGVQPGRVGAGKNQGAGTGGQAAGLQGLSLEWPGLGTRSSTESATSTGRLLFLPQVTTSGPCPLAPAARASQLCRGWRGLQGPICV